MRRYRSILIRTPDIASYVSLYRLIAGGQHIVVGPGPHAGYLGLLTSVCYWQAEQWAVTDNPDPGVHPLTPDPAWCHTPTPEAIFNSLQFDNARRYLVREHTEEMLDLARQQDMDTWLRGQLDLARTWGWQAPDSLHFLLTQSLQAPGYSPPKNWLPQANETPTMHFDRVYQETLYWQGDAPL